MSRYAADTTVSADRSRAEIEGTLQRYGADGFMYGWDGDRAMIRFRMSGRFVRFVVDLPDRNARRFTHTPERGTPRSAEAAHKAWEQACRQRWRALALVVKAKLEAVDAGISEFEDEFLAYVELPDGTTAGEWIRPQIAASYESGAMPQPLLLGTGA